ncbi:hypothetical protein J7K07_02290 [Candidatus Bathyarchaeota archaeon]|nr:hypothetical protein [Candidatus Bathyarchaeota archaeon]MCD6592743.1 hypothetical protein [Candidatus Bathyarchaeota archaeon]
MGLRERILKREKRSMERYKEERETFEKVMGTPKINVSVELPKGYEDRREDFLDLEKEKSFLKDANRALGRVVKKHLKMKEKAEKEKAAESKDKQ